MKRSFKLKNKKGLTLIELMAVIMVLAIISAIAIPFYLKDKKNVDAFTIEQKEKEVQKVIEAWYSTSQQIPIVGQGSVSYDKFKSICSINFMDANSTANLCAVDFTPITDAKKVSFSIKGDNFYIYYNINDGHYYVTNDYPKEYIQLLIEKYKISPQGGGAYPMIGASDEINTSLLVSQGYLPQKPKFKYVLLKNNLVERITNEG